MSQIPPSLPPNNGYVDRTVGIVKGLTFTNVAVFAMLVILLGFAWFIWKIVTDDKLLTTITSNYTELLQVGDCRVAKASPRGGKPMWLISYPYANQGQDRWYFGVTTPSEPSSERAAEYCKALTAASDYAMDPKNQPEPTFPGGNKLMFPPADTAPAKP